MGFDEDYSASLRNFLNPTKNVYQCIKCKSPDLVLLSSQTRYSRCYNKSHCDYRILLDRKQFNLNKEEFNWFKRQEIRELSFAPTKEDTCYYCGSIGLNVFVDGSEVENEITLKEIPEKLDSEEIRKLCKRANEGTPFERIHFLESLNKNVEFYAICKNKQDCEKKRQDRIKYLEGMIESEKTWFGFIYSLYYNEPAPKFTDWLMNKLTLKKFN